ncbi:MAG TPA: cache domain-containing protein, partial [Myxococcales bacterium]|nr:cache domain-containing protein [Myxococcales bacterium]
MNPFSQWTFRGKILTVIAAVSVVPLAITAAVEWREASSMMIRANESLLTANITDVAGDLDSLHDTFRRLVERTARLPEVLKFLDQRGSTEQIEAQLQSILKSDPRLRDLTIFDSAGNVLAATDAAVLSRNFSFRRYFRDAIAGSTGAPDFIYSTGESPAPSVAYAAPIRGHDRVLGVMLVLVRGSAVWDYLHEGNDRAGKGSFALLLDHHGVILGHSSDDTALFHPAGRLGAAEIEHMVEERRFAGETRQLLEQPFSVPGAFDRARGEDLPTFFSVSPQSPRVETEAATRKLANAPWTLFFMVPRAAAWAPVELLVSRTLIATGALGLLALIAGFLLVGTMLKP